jgi:hypothetical protein
LSAGKELRSVSNTPLNITHEEIPKAEVAVGTSQIVENSPEKIDAAIGISQISVP